MTDTLISLKYGLLRMNGFLTFLFLISFIFIDFILIGVFSIPGIVMLLFGPQQQINKNKRNESVVVLIHGSGVSDWQWAVAKAYLYVLKLEFMSVKYNSIQSIVNSCDDVVQQIRNNIPINKSIVLIGHSQGGLIARSIADKVKAKKVFLMNTPQRGAVLLNWLYPKEENYDCSDNDMRYDSPFLRSLPSIKTTDKIYEIVGLNDYVRSEHCIHFDQYVYESWFGHYFTAANPYLWLKYIIPNILK